MNVASFQGPIFVDNARDAVHILRRQLTRCEAENVEMLCTPEAFVGGLADDATEPPLFAIRITNDLCPDELESLADSAVTSIVGFTELGHGVTIYNSAAVLGQGRLHGVYRKVFPAQHRSSYAAGSELPVFNHNGTTFGIVICNDANYVEPARVMAKVGASVLFAPMNNALPVEPARRSLQGQWRTA